MNYWNQLAWTLCWAVLYVVMAVPTVGMWIGQAATGRQTLIGLSLSSLFAFLACRAFAKRGRRTPA